MTCFDEYRGCRAVLIEEDLAVEKHARFFGIRERGEGEGDSASTRDFGGTVGGEEGYVRTA